VYSCCRWLIWWHVTLQYRPNRLSFSLTFDLFRFNIYMIVTKTPTKIPHHDLLNSRVGPIRISRSLNCHKFRWNHFLVTRTMSQRSPPYLQIYFKCKDLVLLPRDETQRAVLLRQQQRKKHDVWNRFLPWELGGETDWRNAENDWVDGKIWGCKGKQVVE